MKETTNDYRVLSAGWSRGERILLKSLGAAAFAMLTSLAAHVRIPLPFTPVPITLQTFIVPLAGGFLGSLWGAGSMLLYMVLGLIGLDVFGAASGGFGFLVSPTAGYVAGFVLAAAIVGWIRDNYKSSVILFGALILSHVVIFVCGVAGLMINANLSLQNAIIKGVLPFMVGDTLKIFASFFVLLSYKHVIRK
jgi:biotin transport system substrate-specific component